MDYWETIELISQDWGMSHPLTDKFDREAIVQLIDEIALTFAEEDAPWLRRWDLRLNDKGQGRLDLEKGREVFRIAPAPHGRLFVGGKLVKPKETYFTYAFYGEVKRRVTEWARQPSGAALRGDRI